MLEGALDRDRPNVAPGIEAERSRPTVSPAGQVVLIERRPFEFVSRGVVLVQGDALAQNDGGGAVAQIILVPAILEVIDDQFLDPGGKRSSPEAASRSTTALRLERRRER